MCFCAILVLSYADTAINQLLTKVTNAHANVTDYYNIQYIGNEKFPVIGLSPQERSCICNPLNWSFPVAIFLGWIFCIAVVSTTIRDNCLGQVNAAVANETMIDLLFQLQKIRATVGGDLTVLI